MAKTKSPGKASSAKKPAASKAEKSETTKAASNGAETSEASGLVAGAPGSTSGQSGVRDETGEKSVNTTSPRTPDPLNRTVSPPTPAATKASELGTPAILGNDPGVNVSATGSATPEAQMEQQSMSPEQKEAFNRHAKIKWDSKEDANTAALMTSHLFSRDKERKFHALVKKTRGNDHLKAIAKKIGFDSVITDETLENLRNA